MITFCKRLLINSKENLIKSTSHVLLKVTNPVSAENLVIKVELFINDVPYPTLQLHSCTFHRGFTCRPWIMVEQHSSKLKELDNLISPGYLSKFLCHVWQLTLLYVFVHGPIYDSKLRVQ